MEEAVRNDLRIAGSTTVAGGVFNRVTIAGQAEINGDIDCIDFKINGGADVRGNLGARTVRVSGNAAVEKNVQSEEVKISGNFTVRARAGVVRGNNVRIGPGCVIGLVEYWNDFERDRRSEVGEVKRTVAKNSAED